MGDEEVAPALERMLEHLDRMHDNIKRPLPQLDMELARDGAGELALDVMAVAVGGRGLHSIQVLQRAAVTVVRVLRDIGASYTVGPAAAHLYICVGATAAGLVSVEELEGMAADFGCWAGVGRGHPALQVAHAAVAELAVRPEERSG